MSVITHQEIKCFCDICVWIYRVWETRRIMFDDNVYIDELCDSYLARHVELLSTVTIEYLLQQIVMLHDPATQGPNENLTLERVVEFGPWNGATRAQLRRLKNDLDGLAVHLKPARNKLLAHIDLPTAMSGVVLGAFPEGDDARYFDNLQQFVNVAHENTLGGPHPLHVSMDCNDAHVFVEALLQYCRGRRNPSQQG